MHSFRQCIITFFLFPKISDKFGLKRQSSSNSIRPPGRPPLVDYLDENSIQQNQVLLWLVVNKIRSFIRLMIFSFVS